MSAPPRSGVGGLVASALWRFDPGIVYLNHAAFGAVPLAAQRFRATLRARMEANPAAWFRAVEADVRDARRRVAHQLGVPADRTVLVPNASAAATIALASLPLGCGDEVLVTGDAYGAVLGAVRRAVGRAGASIRTVTIPLSAPADEIARLVVDRVGARTKAVVLDQVTSSTFRTLPTAVVAREVAPVPVIVDGAHAAGLVPDAPTAAGGAVWFGNLHKFLCAPRATAALVVAPGADVGRIEPLVASWNEDLAFPAPFDVQGTSDATALLAAPWTVDHLATTLGWSRIREHATSMAGLLADALGAAGVGTPAPGGVLVPLPLGVSDTPEGARDLAGRLSLLGVEVGATCAEGRGHLRLTPHAYTTVRDVERAADVLGPVVSARGR